MFTLVAAVVLRVQDPQAETYHQLPLQSLQLSEGQVLPRYEYWSPWSDQLGGGFSLRPYARLDGPGAAADPGASPRVFFESAPGGQDPALGSLFLRCESGASLSGTLWMPRATGEGFLELRFQAAADAGLIDERAFLEAERRLQQERMAARLTGSAWFRHRFEQLSERLGTPAAPDPTDWRPVFTPPEDALSLFSGGRAVSENLQLERALPEAGAQESTVPLAEIRGIEVRAFDWKPLLVDRETSLDVLASAIPADQHALFFSSFKGFVDSLDEADRLGTLGLTVFEQRAVDSHTRARLEHQLGLELSEIARTLGPLAVQSVALTGSDLYLRSGSDLALLFRSRTPEPLLAYLGGRLSAAQAQGATAVQGELAGRAYRGVLTPTRSVCSYLAQVGEAVVVSNSLSQLERLARVAAGEEPALGAGEEYRFFRQRYPRGTPDESLFALLPDGAIRRWCSPRWRIGEARRVRAAGLLADRHVEQIDELVRGVTGEHELGSDPRMPELGQLLLTPQGVWSPVHGTLDFQTPVAELRLEGVSPREKQLYERWRDGYQQNWSAYFDPIAATLSVSPRRTALDLTVMPLIEGTDYDALREVTRGPGLLAGQGDPHPQALAHYTMALDPGWEELQSLGSILGNTARELGADPFSWLGGWLSIYADANPIWDEVLQADDLEEAVENLQVEANELPVALVLGVGNPLKLALFLSALRTFVEGTAPGLTEWKERVEGERRYVEIRSSGLGSEEYSLFYGTTPEVLVLSLRQATLLEALERSEQRRSAAGAPGGGGEAGGPPPGSHLFLELRGDGLRLLDLVMNANLRERLQRQSWENLPILNEWRRRYPDLDPVEVHQRVLREEPVCPGGGRYVWDAPLDSMSSTVFGCPARPEPGPSRPAAWQGLRGASFGLCFEPDGLRVRAELLRE